MSAPTVKCNSCAVTFLQGTKEVQQHYNSAWHVCNVKRSLLGYGPITEEQFAAAEAQKVAPKSTDNKKSSHVKPSKMEKFEKKQVIQKLKADNPQAVQEEDDTIPMEYEPLSCIFEPKMTFATIEDNLKYSKKHFGFDIFEREYVVDLPGLLTMLGEKVWLGGQCLQCNRGFKNRDACINHMIDLRHTRINYEDDKILEEMDPYYDYSASYQKFEEELKRKYSDRLEKIKAQRALAAPANEPTAQIQDATATATAADETDEDWEDFDMDGSDSEIDEDDLDAELSGKNLRKDAKKLLAKYGLTPIERTPEGYLRLMDGTEAAPRSAMKVIKQRTGDLTLIKSKQDEGKANGTINGLRTRLMLTDGSHGNQHSQRSKEELKDVVKFLARQFKQSMLVGVQSNKFTRFAPEPQKAMM